MLYLDYLSKDSQARRQRGCMCTPLFYSSLGTLKLYSTTARNIPTLVASTL